MIKALRKRHLQVWTTLAVLLPVGIIAAVINKPKQPSNELLQPLSTKTLPLIEKTSNVGDYTINIRSDAQHTARQLEWVNKETLTSPSALIYQLNEANDDIDDASLIGRIEGKGTYHFALKNDAAKTYHFVLYDIIHHKIIYSINL